MRAFITFEFSKETKEEIKKIQGVIREASTKGRFKYIDNFHLTIKFLGEVKADVIESIYGELEEKLKGTYTFDVNLNALGCFGRSKDRIRTIYINVDDETDSINKIYNVVNGVCNHYGFKDENRFTPHVTIAQDVILNEDYDLIKEKVNNSFNKSVVFDKIIIMKSEEVKGKRIYTPLRTIHFD